MVGFIAFIWETLMKFRRKINMLRSVDIQRQREFLESLPRAECDLDRSFFQYKSQFYIMPKIECCCLVIASFFMLPIYWFDLSKKERKVKQANEVSCAVYVENTGLGKNIIPLSVQNEFSNIVQVNFGDDMYLDKTAKIFLLETFKKHPFSFYFNFKNMMNVAIYTASILQYKPESIISCSEWSFGSSLNTDYCNSRGVEFINVMHGEKLYLIRDSFFRYNRFYVWDEHYVNLFKSLRADPAQFIVELPPSLSLDLPTFDKNLPEAVELKFYLEIEDDEKLRKLKSVIDILLARGIKLKIRPHPKATERNTILNFFTEQLVEDPDLVPIVQSLTSTRKVVARYSTVLNQAFHSGREIIIDDVTDNVTYKKLFETNYIMLKKEHKLLSSFLKVESVLK